MFYYYIDGSDDVFEREEEVDTVIYPQFRMLFGKELEYYLLHPGSTKSEIKRAMTEDFNKPTLADIKAAKVAELMDFDSSDAVNGFYIAGNIMWLNPATRDNYMNTLQGAKRLGIESVTFMGHDITPDMGIAMLDVINLYAMQCVGVTEHHAATIMSFETEEEVKNYDFTVGYPEKLHFMEEPSEPEENNETVTNTDEPTDEVISGNTIDGTEGNNNEDVE